VFFAGAGVGGVGGFALNDYLEREDPDAIQQIRQELETQQQLDDTFERLQQEQRAAELGTTSTP
jgi:hypothetical protein